jgi:hypothetical protein
VSDESWVLGAARTPGSGQRLLHGREHLLWSRGRVVSALVERQSRSGQEVLGGGVSGGIEGLILCRL